MSKKNDKVPNTAEMSQEELLAYVASLEEQNVSLAEENEKIQKNAAKGKKTVKPDNPNVITDWLEEKIPFQAFKDADRYKDDIVVKLNGERWQIPRGKLHMIPRKVYLVLSDAERQNNLAADVQSDYENEFETNVKGRM